MSFKPEDWDLSKIDWHLQMAGLDLANFHCNQIFKQEATCTIKHASILWATETFESGEVVIRR